MARNNIAKEPIGDELPKLQCKYSFDVSLQEGHRENQQQQTKDGNNEWIQDF